MDKSKIRNVEFSLGKQTLLVTVKDGSRFVGSKLFEIAYKGPKVIIEETERIYCRKSKTNFQQKHQEREFVYCQHRTNLWESIRIGDSKKELFGIRCLQCGVFIPCKMVGGETEQKAKAE